MRIGRKSIFISRVCTLLAAGLLSGCASSGAEAADVAKQGADQIVIGDMEFTVEQMDYRDKVQPPNPLGYYDYYPEEEGYHYLVLSGSAVNAGDTDFDPESFYVEAQAGRTIRKGKLLIVTAPGAEFWDVLPAQQTSGEWGFYLFALLKDSEEADSISIFYNDDFTKNEEGEEWDRQIRITL